MQSLQQSIPLSYTAPARIFSASVAAVVGYLSICFMRRIIRGKKYKYFAIYCGLMGAIAIGFYLMQ